MKIFLGRERHPQGFSGTLSTNTTSFLGFSSFKNLLCFSGPEGENFSWAETTPLGILQGADHEYDDQVFRFSLFKAPLNFPAREGKNFSWTETPPQGL